MANEYQIVINNDIPTVRNNKTQKDELALTYALNLTLANEHVNEENASIYANFFYVVLQTRKPRKFYIKYVMPYKRVGLRQQASTCFGKTHPMKGKSFIDVYMSNPLFTYELDTERSPDDAKYWEFVLALAIHIQGYALMKRRNNAAPPPSTADCIISPNTINAYAYEAMFKLPY